MGTNFAGMSHEGIYDAIQVGAPGTVGGAASQLTGLNKTITDHLDSLDKLATSMAEAWPDENGQNFRSTLGDTITYLRELQANHVVSASSSITQVMSASHEKLSTIQSTIPTPPAVPLAQQEKTFNQHVEQNDGAMNAGTAQESQHIATAKADDAKAVLMAKSLANTYLSEKAKLTAPPAAPKGPAGTGSGQSVAVVNGSGTSSSHAAASYHSAPAPENEAWTATLVGGGSSGGGGHHKPPIVVTPPPPPPHPVDHGTDFSTVAGNDGSISGLPGTNGHGGTLLDPNSVGGPIYDAQGHLIGGAGFDGSGSYGLNGSGGASVDGVLGGDQGSGSGFSSAGLGAAGIAGGLAAAGIIAARRQAAQRAEQAALLKQQLLQEELTGGAGGANGNLTASQLAAINAQRNGILSAGERAGLLSNDRSMLAQERTMLRANAALTAEEQAQLGNGQRVVPGQLGGTAAAGTAGSARRGMPFAGGGGVVGGAERVTWLVEDRDLFSADPGVRAVIDD